MAAIRKEYARRAAASRIRMYETLSALIKWTADGTFFRTFQILCPVLADAGVRAL